jgi:hypothetical protein
LVALIAANLEISETKINRMQETNNLAQTPPLQQTAVSGSVSFIMFKLLGGKKVHEFRLESISEHHAITVAENFYRANGLIGRYYCETENGKMFQINW